MLFGSIFNPFKDLPLFLSASIIGDNGWLIFAVIHSWKTTMTLPSLYQTIYITYSNTTRENLELIVFSFALNVYTYIVNVGDFRFDICNSGKTD